GELERSAARIWASRDPVVMRELRKFGFSERWQWNSQLPMHPSGIPFVDLLEKFSFDTQWLADALSDDLGGPRRATAFDHLITDLAGYFRLVTEPLASSRGRFFRFIAAVVDLARSIEKSLPAADFKLPPGDTALYVRLRRLAQRAGTTPEANSGV